MLFENEFEVAGNLTEVIEKFDNLPLMASFLPGASLGEVNTDGSYPGTLIVSFGPKRITFKGNISNQVDKTSFKGTLSGTASADVRGAKMAVTMEYSLTQCTPYDEPLTKVKLVSHAQLTGVLEQFAKTGGVVLTNAILAEFAIRFSADLEQPGDKSATLPSARPTMSATSLASRICKSMLGAVTQILGKVWRTIAQRPQ